MSDEQLRNHAVGLIRSLLIASKGGVHLNKLERDYVSLVGEPIPFRKLRYSSLAEFLDQSPDLCRVTYKSDGIYVNGVATVETAHIARMVSAQRSTAKKGAKARPKPAARRPNVQKQWQPPAPTSPFGQGSQGQQRGFNQQQRGGNNRSANRPGGSGRFQTIQNRNQQQGGGNRQPPVQRPLRTPNYATSGGPPGIMLPPTGSGVGRGPQTPGGMMSNGGGRPTSQMPFGGGGHSQISPRPSMNHQQQQQQNRNQNNHHSQHINNSRPQQQQSNASTTSSTARPKNCVKILQQYFADNSASQGLGILTFKTATLEMKSGGGNNKNNKSKGKTQTRYVSTVKVGEQSFQTFPNEFPTKEQAEEAAAAMAVERLGLQNYPACNAFGNNTSNNARHVSPTTTAATTSANNKTDSNVMSMPIGTFAVEDVAKEMASNVTISEKAKMATNNPDIDIEQFVDRIVKLVGKRSNGVWSTQIDVEFKKSFKQTLPDKWPDKIEKSEAASRRLRVDRPIEGRYIIYPILDESGEPVSLEPVNANNAIITGIEAVAAAMINGGVYNCDPQQDMLSSPIVPIANNVPHHPQAAVSRQQQPQFGYPASTGQPRPPGLICPEEDLWDVYVTCIHSTVNVCVRLLGENYSNKFDDLVTNMELKYHFDESGVGAAGDAKKDDLRVANPEVGALYAAKVESDWHRVEVTNVSGLEVTCYFIDHGDEDVLSMKDLRRLSPEFFSLAPQAKAVRLAGLEDFRDSQEAQNDLTNLALGRSLVGQVHTKDEHGISLILYDTSGNDEDVNINEKMLDKYRPGDAASKAGIIGSVSNKTNNSSSSNSSRIASPSPSSSGSGPTQPPPLERPTGRILEHPPMETLQAMDLNSMEPLLPTNVPKEGDFFDVNVTLAASPSNFTVQPWSDVTVLEDFQAAMKEFYGKTENVYKRQITQEDIGNSLDKYYAARHTDGQWYRVRVNASVDDNTVAAKIVDYGDFTMVPYENLQPLWPQFRHLPIQSVNANLADIVAKNGDWSTDDTIWFSQRVVGRQFVSKIKDITFDPLEYNVRISVSLVDTTHPTTDIYIEKQLVKEDRAVFLCV